MLTFVDAISLAGDRAKQNDDAYGALGRCAWVIDGATDLDSPITNAASDAAWLAASLNLSIFDLAAGADHFGADADDIRLALQTASELARDDVSALPAFASAKPWQSPTASVLIVSEHDGKLTGVELGDCRCFALDATGTAHSIGGPPNAADDEQRAAARAGQVADPGALLRNPAIMERLRAKRALHNTEGEGGYWVFGLQPDCAWRSRDWTLVLSRPAHILLMTDGFAALTDRYAAYDAGGLVRAALEKGLHELARELRAIETADAGGAKHPRFKASDDATALLLRLA